MLSQQGQLDHKGPRTGEFRIAARIQPHTEQSVEPGIFVRGPNCSFSYMSSKFLSRCQHFFRR